MARKRVYEVAKELGLSSKEALEKLAAAGIEVKSHSSSIDDDEQAKLSALVDSDGKASPPSEPAKDKPLAKPKKAPAVAEVIAEPDEEPSEESEDVAEALKIPRGATVEEIARRFETPANTIIKTLLEMGQMKTINQSLTDEEVDLLAQEVGLRVEIVSPEEEAEAVDEPDDEEVDPADLEPRPPVITVMGHVDHGKSSILQHFRRKDMLSLEAGGITQAIGAYQVHSNEKVVTFIDTPGHEAFTQMRARGAQVTDLAVLVVAADDGVQPQTVEALDHAKAASVPVIVAVNKTDKPEADPTRVRQQLSELGLQPEEWGGETVYVDVSAKQGTNMDQLLEMIMLVTEMQDLRSTAKIRGRGVAIEGHLDKGRGAIATLLVQRGSLGVGDPVVCGSAWARVRALTDEHGNRVEEAGPSQPVQVSGWSKVPSAGDEFRVLKEERDAKHLAQEREARIRQAGFVTEAKPRSLEEILSFTAAGGVPELKLVVKADAQGPLEALIDALEKKDSAEVRVNVLRRGVGAITENDVNLAEASGAIVVGFKVRPDAGARKLAEAEGVDVRPYEVIYQLLEDIEKATKGLLAPIEEEVITGSAEVRKTFRVPAGMVAGCYVTDGQIARGAKARLLRDGTVVYSSTVDTLRRFKEDVREVESGYECGIHIENYDDVQEGDVIEAYEIRQVART